MIMRMQEGLRPDPNLTGNKLLKNNELGRVIKSKKNIAYKSAVTEKRHRGKERMISMGNEL